MPVSLPCLCAVPVPNFPLVELVEWKCNRKRGTYCTTQTQKKDRMEGLRGHVGGLWAGCAVGVGVGGGAAGANAEENVMCTETWSSEP